MPSLRNSQISTEDSMTEVCAWQPRRDGNCSSALRASGLFAALTESAISVSSVWRRGFLLPRYCVFNSWIGRIASGEITWFSWGIPASSFNAFRRRAEEAPSSSEVLPKIIRPSGSSRAAAGPSVSFSFWRLAGTTLRSSREAWACFRSSSILRISSSVPVPVRSAAQLL